MLTPDKTNYKERIMRSYLLGRGNKNIHTITNGESVLSVPIGEAVKVNTMPRFKKFTPPFYLSCFSFLLMLLPLKNIIGPAALYTTRMRGLEADDILRAFDSDNSTGTASGSFEGENGFVTRVLKKDPDSLKKTITSSVKQRRETWKAFCASKHYPPKTDLGHLIAAAYVGGMVSPSYASRFMAVQPESLEHGSEWTGNIEMYTRLASVLEVSDEAETEQDTRAALAFFAGLVGSNFV